MIKNLHTVKFMRNYQAPTVTRHATHDVETTNINAMAAVNQGEAMEEKEGTKVNVGDGVAVAAKNDGRGDDKDDCAAPEINGDDGGDDASSLAAEAPGPTDPANSVVDDAAATTTTKTTTATTTTPVAPLSGFFSRAAASVQQARLGEVYDLAQKRAARLREGAIAEVERLRQQQTTTAGGYEIPPPAGVLIVGDPPSAIGEGEAAVNDNDDDDDDDDNKTSRNDVEGGTMNARTNDVVARLAVESKKGAATTTTTTIRDISTPLIDAFNMVKMRSTEVANELIFPIDAFSARDDDDDDEEEEDDDDNIDNIHSSSNEEGYSSSSSGDSGGVGNCDEKDGGRRNDDGIDPSGDVKSGAPGTAASLVALNLTPTRFTAATSSVINAAVGRYRRLKEGSSASYDASSSPLPPTPPPHPGTVHHQKWQPRQQDGGEGAAVVVGGAALVGGLHNFRLDGLLYNNISHHSTAVAGGSASAIPSPPFPTVSYESTRMRACGFFDSPMQLS
jgi:hypothetical protein